MTATAQALTQQQVDLRGKIVKALRESQTSRRVLLEFKPLEATALDRAFVACAEAGIFNRQHPEYAISVTDLIEIVPAIGPLVGAGISVGEHI